MCEGLGGEVLRHRREGNQPWANDWLDSQLLGRFKERETEEVLSNWGRYRDLVSEEEGRIARELLEDLKKSMASAKKAQKISK
jgi:hypothetical protein